MEGLISSGEEEREGGVSALILAFILVIGAIASITPLPRTSLAGGARRADEGGRL
jgi:hypothetical protein